MKMQLRESVGMGRGCENLWDHARVGNDGGCRLQTVTQVLACGHLCSPCGRQHAYSEPVLKDDPVCFHGISAVPAARAMPCLRDHVHRTSPFAVWIRSHRVCTRSGVAPRWYHDFSAQTGRRCFTPLPSCQPVSVSRLLGEGEVSSGQLGRTTVLDAIKNTLLL